MSTTNFNISEVRCGLLSRNIEARVEALQQVESRIPAPLIDGNVFFAQLRESARPTVIQKMVDAAARHLLYILPFGTPMTEGRLEVLAGYFNALSHSLRLMPAVEKLSDVRKELKQVRSENAEMEDDIRKKAEINAKACALHKKGADMRREVAQMQRRICDLKLQIKEHPKKKEA